ncbi:MAG TPA: hypothetical protein VFY49_07345 [Myxococcota bacterium]|nr:hypothetical protein [Myxococcota bacterium]
MRSWRMLIGLAAVLGAVSARASHLDGDVFTFDTPPSSIIWSHQTTTNGRLGPFRTETVSLQGMDYLSTFPVFPTTAYLGFDIILNGSWGGDFADDRFIVVANGQTVLDETFSNVLGFSQSYPVPGSSARTGGTEIVGVGWSYTFALTFQLTPSFPDCCTDIAVSFRGTGANWFLDNVVVSSTPIPEPHTLPLVTGGLIALGARARRAQDLC